LPTGAIVLESDPGSPDAPPTAGAPEAGTGTPAGPTGCLPSADDGPGPNYTPGAPERTAVGSGYTLRGTVLGEGDCRPLAAATVEFWLAGPDGQYGDDYRATLHTDPTGSFTFLTHPAPSYGGNAPHIHVRVSATGYRDVFLVHRPGLGDDGQMAVVLARE
jgi:protocatechuate 3,4-dioxygenase beta subunit